MAATVYIYAPLSDALGLGKNASPLVVELPAGPDSTLRTLLAKIAEMYPAFATLTVPMAVALDGRLVQQPVDSDVSLRDGAKVVLLAAYVGG